MGSHWIGFARTGLGGDIEVVNERGDAFLFLRVFLVYGACLREAPTSMISYMVMVLSEEAMLPRKSGPIASW